ncbi:unnamed protein product [Brassica rapa subsp. narinosa]
MSSNEKPIAFLSKIITFIFITIFQLFSNNSTTNKTTAVENLPDGVRTSPSLQHSNLPKMELCTPY